MSRKVAEAPVLGGAGTAEDRVVSGAAAFAPLKFAVLRPSLRPKAAAKAAAGRRPQRRPQRRWERADARNAELASSSRESHEDPIHVCAPVKFLSHSFRFSPFNFEPTMQSGTWSAQPGGIPTCTYDDRKVLLYLK